MPIIQQEKKSFCSSFSKQLEHTRNQTTQLIHSCCTARLSASPGQFHRPPVARAGIVEIYFALHYFDFCHIHARYRPFC